MLKPVKLSIIELLTLIFTATLVSAGIVISRIDVAWFENIYAVEDGFVENWTVVPLIVATFYAVFLYSKLNKHKPWQFKVISILIACFSIFVAGEEISWGQRIFNVESSTFFLEHNAQGETNLHNMVVGDKKINKIIFSQLLTVLMAFYLLVLPVVHKKNKKWREFIDMSGIPIPQRYQIVSCLILFVSISLIPSGKNAEILEAGITTLFLLIFLFPKNAEAFALIPQGSGEHSNKIALNA
ncbi:hypothetical protein [Sphingobacterium sp. LRF_L2]|uniref:hypothetical protein n=1 Tax=Sphingobacterium sp. LRF_L2 TaxID=3369421 RepID=UPI003F630792